MPVKAGEIVPHFGWQLARKGAHCALSDNVVQELGLAVNALSSARHAATLVLVRSPRKLDAHRDTVHQLNLWKPLSEEADTGGSPPPDLMLRCDDFCSARAGTALGSYDGTRLLVTRRCLTPQEMVSEEARFL